MYRRRWNCIPGLDRGVMGRRRFPQAMATTDVLAVMSMRCEACHSEHPRLMWKAPRGLILSSIDDVDRNAAAIYRTVVQSRVMPPIWNVTPMTESERAQIARWFAGRPPL